jgi:hypothetical protein
MTDAPTDTTESTEDVPPVEETDWKAEARKWETRAKDNARAAKRLTEIEDAQKTELQKALERAEAAESRISQYETEQQLNTWRTEIAEASGVAAAALRGSTREELEAHAEILKPLIGEKRGPVVRNPGDTPTSSAAEELTAVRSLFG